VQSRHTDGKLARDETAEYEVYPDPGAPGRKVTKISGSYWKHGQYVDFTGHEETKGDGLDESLTQSFRNDFVDDFPLTSAEQKKYRFDLLGEQDVHGRRAWRIGFRPADKNDIDWAGEALIDQQDFQPVNVFTKLSRRIPFAIRTLLGTDLPGIGYNLTYRRLDEGVWLPASYGAEFTLHILFFLNREINVDTQNSGFRRTAAGLAFSPLSFSLTMALQP
jgi:hypothetical protein